MPTAVRYVGDDSESIVLSVAPGMDLTGGTAVVDFQKPDGTRMVRTGALNAGARTISYTWDTGELDLAGEWWAQGVVTVGDVVAHTAPVSFIVGYSR